MEVKINKNNNQKYVNLPKDSDFYEGDKVNIIKIKDLTKNDLKNYFEENKEKFKKQIEILQNHYQLLDVSPENLFIEHYRKTFKIKEMQGECSVYELGDTIVKFDLSNGTIEDSDNFVDIEHAFSFEPILKNVTNGKHEGYVFDEKKYTKEQMKNSAIISFYIKLKKLQYKEEMSFLDSLFEKLDFIGLCFDDYDSRDDFFIWINKKNNIKLIRDNLKECSYKLSFVGKKRIEFDISEFVKNE